MFYYFLGFPSFGGLFTGGLFADDFGDPFGDPFSRGG